MKRRFLIILTIAAILVMFTAPAGALDSLAAACTDISEANLDPSPGCLEAMNNFPEPVVTPIPRDGYSLSNYDFWRVTSESPLLYDAPAGAVIGQMPGGFNFVQATEQSGDWIRNRTGNWMNTEDVTHQPTSEFRGVRLLNGLEDQFGWVLGDLVTSPTPGARQSLDTGVVKYRYDLVNIFAEVRHDDGWLWYMVGPDQWIEQRSLAIAKPIEQPEGIDTLRWVAVDLYEQTLVGYEGTRPVFATLISSGLPGWDTHEGLFDIWARIDRDGMSGATGAPDAYALESVPWVMYFDDAISLHGTYWHDGFGYRHSHGCVNLSISDAAHIFSWTGQQEPDEDGNIRSQVYVYASGEYRSSGSATK